MSIALSTIVVKKVIGGSTSTATLNIIRMVDGGIKFVDVKGNTVIAHSNDAISRLFTKLEALV